MASDTKHVHDCTGPDMTCPCGWKFTVPRFNFTLEVWDNKTKRSIVDEMFSTDGLYTIASAIRDRLEELEEMDLGEARRGR